MLRNLAIIFALAISCQAKTEKKKTESVEMNDPNVKTEIATFGAGCFWCVEAVFLELDGVTKVVSGYEGGKVDNPTYKLVLFWNNRSCRSNSGNI